MIASTILPYGHLDDHYDGEEKRAPRFTDGWGDSWNFEDLGMKRFRKIREQGSLCR